MVRPLVIISLGADTLAPLGNSIVGGQALFARSFAEKISNFRATTLITLKFEGMKRKHAKINYPYEIIEIKLPGDSYYADSLWENLDIIEDRCRRVLNKYQFKNSVVVSVYWISGHIICNGDFVRPYKWLHTHSSFGHLNAKVTRSKSNTKYIHQRINSERLISHEADYCWATCDYERNLLRKNFEIPNDKIISFARSIDLSIFKPLKCNPEYPCWDIIFVGRLDERKGIYDIPAILSNFSSSKGFKIAIIGGSFSESVGYKKWFISNHYNIYTRHNISFIPAVPHINLPWYFGQSKVLLIPSHYEIFGNIVLEGLACGIPVVATSVGGIPELIRKKKQGSTYQPGQFSDAAKLIKYYLQSEIFPRSDRHLDNINKYNWPNLIKKFMEKF